MINSYSENRDRFRTDSSVLGVDGEGARFEHCAFTGLQGLHGPKAEIVREAGINPALATGVVSSTHVEFACNVPKIPEIAAAGQG